MRGFALGNARDFWRRFYMWWGGFLDLEIFIFLERDVQQMFGECGDFRICTLQIAEGEVLLFQKANSLSF